MSKIYVASSWRNQDQPHIVQILREHGHDVYDFRNPSSGYNGFHWSEIDPDWRKWTKYKYRENLNHHIAVYGYNQDMSAMMWADTFVGVQPFGRSASMEMGWASGQGKRTILLIANGEPELMVKMFDHLCCNLKEVLSVLNSQPLEEKCFSKCG
jgi:hypothetical protein